MAALPTARGAAAAWARAARGGVGAAAPPPHGAGLALGEAAPRLRPAAAWAAPSRSGGGLARNGERSPAAAAAAAAAASAASPTSLAAAPVLRRRGLGGAAGAVAGARAGGRGGARSLTSSALPASGGGGGGGSGAAAAPHTSVEGRARVPARAAREAAEAERRRSLAAVVASSLRRGGAAPPESPPCMVVARVGTASWSAAPWDAKQRRDEAAGAAAGPAPPVPLKRIQRASSSSSSSQAAAVAPHAPSAVPAPSPPPSPSEDGAAARPSSFLSRLASTDETGLAKALVEGMNVPNALTMTRLVATPYLAHLILSNQMEAAIAGCFVAGVLDFFDGYLARRWNQRTVVGAFLDPLADKVFIGCIVGSLAWRGLFPPELLALIVGRDAVLLAGSFVVRGLTKPQGQRFFEVQGEGVMDVKPTAISRVNTVLQMSLMGFAMTKATWLGLPSPEVFSAMCWVVAGTTVASGLSYADMSALKLKRRL